MPEQRNTDGQDVVTNQAWRIKILEQGLAQLGQALVIVSSRGRVEFSSSAAHQILSSGQGLLIQDEILIAESAPDNQRLQNAIQQVLSEENEYGNAMGIYVHRAQYSRPFYLSISRMPKQADERREGHSLMILIKDLRLNFEHWTERLSAEFGLSHRELESVVMLTERRDIAEIAEVLGLSIETVRQYVKSSFKKMGVQKQHELVSLALEYRRNR
jgi:DNA-binding CsgD family transcriptional regulator